MSTAHLEAARTWFITGTNRGIGLEMARQLLQETSNIVIAACRDPSGASALQVLRETASGTLHIVRLEVTDRKSIRACADEVSNLLGSSGIDYIVNNAGVNLGDKDVPSTMDIDILEEVFAINVAGPAAITQAFLPLVEKSTKKTIVNISSTLGSVGADMGPVHTSYSISKTAMNMLTYKQAKERPDLTVVAMCPGRLQTDMGGPDATHHVSVGVAGVIKTILSLDPEDSGKFRNHRGKYVVW
ncbi:NAD-P-binding protein [Earliella scabrosa]|nr:NAD-P-binding protein [Earliella scabrosa]